LENIDSTHVRQFLEDSMGAVLPEPGLVSTSLDSHASSWLRLLSKFRWVMNFVCVDIE
jgi:hypothetical protein